MGETFYITGFTTNGEFNSLRWKGNTRPLTILQVRTEARLKYQNKGLKTLMDMVTPCGTDKSYVHIVLCACTAYTYMYNMQCSIIYISYVVTYYTNMCSFRGWVYLC